MLVVIQNLSYKFASLLTDVYPITMDYTYEILVLSYFSG